MSGANDLSRTTWALARQGGSRPAWMDVGPRSWLGCHGSSGSRAGPLCGGRGWVARVGGAAIRAADASATARGEEMIRIALSSCPIFFRAPGVALLLLVVRLERDDFRMKRTEDSVSLAIGSNGSDRNLLIFVMSKSGQNSSVEVWEDCLGHATRKFPRSGQNCSESKTRRAYRYI